MGEKPLEEKEGARADGNSEKGNSVIDWFLNILKNFNNKPPIYFGNFSFCWAVKGRVTIHIVMWDKSKFELRNAKNLLEAEGDSECRPDKSGVHKARKT